MLTDVPLPRGTDPGAAFDLITRGREELARLVDVASIARHDGAFGSL
ncbi:hypothetical protein [Streptomyces sp. NRRL F-5650]|nr:hypothetical protein [Streptomyces sp. NRRL F-5650]